MTALTGGEVLAVLDHQTSVMERLAAGDPLPAVLDSIVLALEDLMPGSRCSILLLDDSGLLRHGSAPTLPRAYSGAIDGLAPGPRAGSCGTAVHLGQSVIATDIRTDPRWEDFRALATPHGLRACWSSPIRSFGQLVGTFAVYHDTPYEPDGRDTELVRRFSHLSSIAVQHDRAARDRDARHEADVARQSAERANHAKSQFVTALSHELRTPLQAITGFTENLQTLDLSADQRRVALERVSAAVTHILSIVDDVLDLARVEAGSMPIQVQDLDVGSAVEACRELLQPLADRKDITIACDGTGAQAAGDPRRLQQVIINLASNAIRFSPPGSLLAIQILEVGDTTCIQVVDQGPGIPRELLDRLFVPFDRLGADAGREGGAGLGLVLARRLTEAMGGTLELDSVVGVGTHVTVSLPRVVTPRRSR